MGATIGLDIGGTKISGAVVDGSGAVLAKGRKDTPAHDPAAIVEEVASLIRELSSEHEVEAVGVACAGFIDRPRSTVYFAPNLAWQDEPLKERLESVVDLPIVLENDANAAAWGEFRFGAGRGCAEFLFVTVSTGVGAGLVLDGRLHLARNGMDAELGETLMPDGRTLEQHASGSALATLAAQQGYPSGPALCDAADAGDAIAEAHLRHGIRALAGKLADLAVLLGIERTAIGGGLGLRAGYVERLREELHRLPALYRHEIMRAQLGADAGLHGGAALASEEKLRSF